MSRNKTELKIYDDYLSKKESVYPQIIRFKYVLIIKVAPSPNIVIRNSAWYHRYK